jgi:hypothetical protein
LILTVIFHEQFFHPKNALEVDDVITDIVENSVPEQPDDPWSSAGEYASFSYNDHGPTANLPHSYLQVAVNPDTGFGGLIWYVRPTWQGWSAAGDVAKHVWVADNPNPPAFDARVVADNCLPRFFTPRSTLPVDQVRIALREYALKGTGERPESVQWVIGNTGGKRFDDIELPDDEDAAGHF